MIWCTEFVPGGGQIGGQRRRAGRLSEGRQTTAAVMSVPAVAGLPGLDDAPASAADGGLGGESCRGSHDGPWRRAGLLLACGGRWRCHRGCLAADGDDILTSGSGGLRALAGAAGIRVGLSRPGRLAAQSALLPARVGPQLSGLGAGGCPGVAGQSELRRLAALTSSGSQVGSQRAAAPGDAGPRPATVAAGESGIGPRQATSGGGRSVYGMQEVRSSSLRSSTSQLNAINSNISGSSV